MKEKAPVAKEGLGDVEKRIQITRTEGDVSRSAGLGADIHEVNVNPEALTSVEHLAEVQRLAKPGSWTYDFKTDRFVCSDELYNVFGTDKQTFTFTQDSYMGLIDEEDRANVQQISRHAQETGEDYILEYRITTPKAERRVIQELGHGEKDVNGKVIRLFGIAQDISARKNAEWAVKESEAKYHSFFENSMDSLFLLGPDGQILEANPAACDTFQMTEAQIFNVGFNGIVDIADQGLDPFREERQRAGKARAEITFIRKDGSRFPGEITSAVYKDDYGEERTSIIIRDITERRKAKEKLITSQQLYSDLFLMSPQPMWVFDTETFRFIQVNKAAMDLYGYSKEEFMNMTLMDIKPKEDINQAKVNIKRRTAGYGVSKDTFKHYKKSGETIEVEIYSNPIVFQDKVYLLVIASDVTEKNQQEHRIIKAIIKTQEEERYEISGELHENVCQILATSQLTLGTLRELQEPGGVVLVNQSKEYITRASREIRKLSHRLAPPFYSFTTLEQEFITLLKSFAPEEKYKIELHVDSAVKHHNINLDLKLNLYRILQEQLRNTFKHANCTKIEVKILVRNNKLKMIISDDGVGFEVNAVSDGLGLSNMKRRVSLFSGKLEVDSSPGNGCTVVIDIPLNQIPDDK